MESGRSKKGCKRMTEQEETRRKQVLKKLYQTQRGETVCLMYWEVETLLDYIEEIRRGRKYGHEKVPKAGS